MPSGMTVTNIRIATSESWKDKASGAQQERTEWHSIALFGRLGEIAAEYLRKGSQVFVEGKLRTRKWQDKQGNDRFTTEIIADNMQMLGGRAGGGGGGGGGPSGGAERGGGSAPTSGRIRSGRRRRLRRAAKRISTTISCPIGHACPAPFPFAPNRRPEPCVRNRKLSYVSLLRHIARYIFTRHMSRPVPRRRGGYWRSCGAPSTRSAVSKDESEVQQGRRSAGQCILELPEIRRGRSGFPAVHHRARLHVLALGALVIPALKITPAQFGLIVSAYAFSAGVSGFLTAGFADRFDRKKLLLFFYSGFLVGTGVAVWPRYHWLLLARMVTGVSVGVVGSISSIVSSGMRGRADGGFIAFAGGAAVVFRRPAAVHRRGERALQDRRRAPWWAE